jgi:cyanophycinase
VLPLRLLLPLLGLAAGPGAAAANPAFDVWLTGNPADATPAATRPGLLLLGGGGDVAAAWRWFVECAGGGDIVILRASGADGYNAYVHTTIGGVDSVQTVRFNSASAAHDPGVLAIVAAADGLFLAGGDQARYIRLWKDTPIEEAINAHLRAGKPLGGTSAGLAVLGEHHFAALEDSITSEQALRNPFDRRVTLGRDFVAAPLLAGVLTDSHFMARKRLGRLITFLARIAAVDPAGRLLGLGIDEATALCVEPDGNARVLTEKAGLAWLVLPGEPPARLAPGEPLRMENVTVIGLGPDSTFNLRSLAVTRPAAMSRVSAAGGSLSEAR